MNDWRTRRPKVSQLNAPLDPSAGIAALLQYTADDSYVRWPDDIDHTWRRTLHENLAAALEKIARA